MFRNSSKSVITNTNRSAYLWNVLCHTARHVIPAICETLCEDANVLETCPWTVVPPCDNALERAVAKALGRDAPLIAAVCVVVCEEEWC